MHHQDWMDDDKGNVFEMYVANGGAGFWVRRTTWGGTCARVVRVGEMTAPAPYFGNPSVLMDVYSLCGQLKEQATQLPVPGTYKTWRQIEPPEWADTAKLRPLDDPLLDTVLTRLDKQRGKGNPRTDPGQVEKVLLNVPFSRKDEAKKLGARWSPVEKSWWLPASNAAAIAEARKLGFMSPDHEVDART